MGQPVRDEGVLFWLEGDELALVFREEVDRKAKRDGRGCRWKGSGGFREMYIV